MNGVGMKEHETHESVTNRVGVRLTPALRRLLEETAAQEVVGRPRLGTGVSYTARMALEIGLEVMRVTRRVSTEGDR
jgi:hypothetical protein